MFKQAIIQLFERDLGRLVEEINLYTDETDLWQTGKGISNSAGNLCLHLIGNLNHFIGAAIGNTGYLRDREREFNQTNVPQAELLTMLDSTRKVVLESLEAIGDSDLKNEYPLEVMGKRYPTGFFLLHLSGHLNYHLGQINYHRRLLTWS